MSQFTICEDDISGIKRGEVTIKSKCLSILTLITLLTIVTYSGQAQGGGASTPTPTAPSAGVTVTPSSEEILPIVVELMIVDEDCLLPCFWGFRIGENSTEETTDFVASNFQQSPHISEADEREEFVESEEAITRGIDFYETFLSLSSEGGSLQVIFGSVDDILVRTDIRLFMAANWLKDNPFILTKILDTYGEPTGVYLRYSGAPTIGYVLALVYEEQGFIVEYGFGNNLSSNERLMNERITEEGKLLICAEDATYDSIDLTLQIDGNPIPLIEVLQPAVDDPTVFRPFWDIEDMTGLSVEDFTEAFAGNPDACIEAFSLSELREQGYE